MSDALVERMAKAIDPQAWEDGPWFEADPPRKWRRENARMSARAALEAIREPTEAMMAIGFGDTGDLTHFDECRAAWRAMIDAALKESD